MPRLMQQAVVHLPFPAFRRDRTEMFYLGRPHVVRRETRDGEAIVLEDVESGRPETLTAGEFWSAYENADLVIEDEALDRLPSRFVAAVEREVEPSVEKDGWASFRRFKYCKAFDETPVSKSERGFGPLIAHVKAAIRDPMPPDWRTVTTWLRERGTPSRRLLRYMASHDHLKGRTDWLDEEVDLVVEETIEEYHKNRAELSPKEVAEAVQGALAVPNAALRKTLGLADDAYNGMSADERRALGFLIAPHVTTVLRRIRRHEGYETTRARSGKRKADGIFRAVGKPPKAKRVNEVWYIDHTRLDGHLVLGGKGRSVLGRPWVTIVVDAFSRLIVGIFVSFIPPSIHSVSAALKNAIRPKLYVAEDHPQVDGTWAAMGLPRVIVCDRALEFTGGSFERACAALGIEVVWCPRHRPQWKGIVERTVRTFNTDFVDIMPGATRNARAHRAEGRDPSEEAEIDFGDLDRHLHRWLVDVYPRKVHAGLNRKPGDVYAEGVRERRPTMPRKVSDLDVLGFRFRRTLSRKGVLFLGLRFTDRQHVFEMLDAAGRGSVKVDIFVDPADLKAVTVVCPTTGVRQRLRARDPELADTTLWERRNLLAWMRAKNYDLADREHWLIAKKEMRDEWTARARAKGRMASRNRAARGLEIGSRGTAPEGPTILNRVLDVDNDPWIETDLGPPDDDEPDDALVVPVPDAPGRPPAAVRKAVAERKAPPRTVPAPAAANATPRHVADIPADIPAPPPQPIGEPSQAAPAPGPEAAGDTARERLRARLAATRTPSLSRS